MESVSCKKDKQEVKTKIEKDKAVYALVGQSCKYEINGKQADNEGSQVPGV